MTFNPNFRIVDNDYKKEKAIEEIEKLYAENHYVEVELRTAKTRTARQHRALHVFCRTLAMALREKDMDTKKFFKEGFEVPFTTEIVKDNIWKPIQKALTDKESSKQLTTNEVSQIYDTINKLLAERGIHVPWPSRNER